MERPPGTRARGAQPRARRTRAATYNESIVSARAVSQRPMSWLKAAAFQNLRAAHGGTGGTRAAGQGNATARGVGARRTGAHAARTPGHASAGAGPAGSRGGERETYVSRMFTTLAVSQSARLLLKRADCANKESVVFARDTSHLPKTPGERARTRGCKQGAHRRPAASAATLAWCAAACRCVPLLARCLRSSLAPKDPRSRNPA